MLVLTRKVGERIAIGEGVVLVVKEIRGHHPPRVVLGFEAPREVPIKLLKPEREDGAADQPPTA